LSLAEAIGSGVWTIRPRPSSRQPRGLIYWGGIAEHDSAKTFWNCLRTQSQEQLTEHLAHHVFRLSHLAKQKYVWASVSKTVDGIRGDKEAYRLPSSSEHNFAIVARNITTEPPRESLRQHNPGHVHQPESYLPHHSPLSLHIEILLVVVVQVRIKELQMTQDIHIQEPPL
jgi:hypothetical protein